MYSYITYLPYTQYEDPQQGRRAGTLQVRFRIQLPNLDIAKTLIHAKSYLVKGGVGGGLLGVAVGGFGVWAASARYPAFRKLTIPFRAFLVASSGSFSGKHTHTRPITSMNNQLTRISSHSLGRPLVSQFRSKPTPRPRLHPATTRNRIETRGTKARS